MPTFMTMLMKLATAQGEHLTEERVEIYFEDLAEFPLEMVLNAMIWARKNLTHFPKIPELREHIEGNPEDRSNLAWKALMKLLPAGPTSTVILTDPVMGKTIIDLWGDWEATYRTFARTEGEIASMVLRKTFKTSYMENWKHRDECRGPVVFRVPEPDPYNLVIAVEINEYIVDNYEVRLQNRRTIQPEIGDRGPMPAYMRQRFEQSMRQIGKGGTRDAYDPAVPGSQDLPAPRLWNIDNPGDDLALRKILPGVRPLRVHRDHGDAADVDRDTVDAEPSQSDQEHCTC